MRARFSRLFAAVVASGLLVSTTARGQNASPASGARPTPPPLESVSSETGGSFPANPAPSASIGFGETAPCTPGAYLLSPLDVGPPSLAAPGADAAPAQAGYIRAPLPAVVHEPIGTWLDAEYLLWWIRDNHIPPLVTTGVPANAKVLGPPGPVTLFSGGDVDEGSLSGGRFTFGMWLSGCHVVGLEATYFFLGRDLDLFASGPVDTVLRPTPPGAFPTLPSPGSFRATLSSTLQSADTELFADLSSARDLRVQLLGGFRYVQLHEAVDVDQTFVSSSGSKYIWIDDFHTWNNFYGADMGVRGEYSIDDFFINGSAKVALGVTDEGVDVNGGLTQITTVTSLDNFGNPVKTIKVVSKGGGGLLETPASFQRDRFTVIPEVGLNIGYQFRPWLRGWVGYSLLYWSSVVRPGDQIVTAPKAADFWAQGLNLGLGLEF